MLSSRWGARGVILVTARLPLNFDGDRDNNGVGAMETRTVEYFQSESSGH